MKLKFVYQVGNSANPDDLVTSVGSLDTDGNESSIAFAQDNGDVLATLSPKERALMFAAVRMKAALQILSDVESVAYPSQEPVNWHNAAVQDMWDFWKNWYALRCRKLGIEMTTDDAQKEIIGAFSWVQVPSYGGGFNSGVWV